MSLTYYEGTLFRAFYYPGATFRTALFFEDEELAVDHCDRDVNCVGYWKRDSGEFRCLYPGGKEWTWAAGHPNKSVVSVKVKGTRGTHPSYQVQQMLTPSELTELKGILVQREWLRTEGGSVDHQLYRERVLAFEYGSSTTCAIPTRVEALRLSGFYHAASPAPPADLQQAWTLCGSPTSGSTNDVTVEATVEEL